MLSLVFPIDLLNVYIVENLAQSIVASLLVGSIVVFLVRSPAARSRFLLVPLVLPALGPPLYYLLVPHRQELPVIPLDRILGLKQGLSFVSQWPLFTTIFGIAFILALLYFLTRGAIAVAVAQYLPRRYSRPPREQTERLEGIITPLLVRSTVRRPILLQSRSPYLSCCAFGLRRPYLLISAGLLEDLDDEHLAAVLAHELAHFMRRDQYLNLAILAIRSFLFFNPFVHLLCRAISLEQELACDALAIRMGQRPLVYAQSLVRVSRQSGHSGALREPATCAFLTRSASLRRRVNAILERGGIEGPERRPLFFGVTGSLLVLLFFIC